MRAILRSEFYKEASEKFKIAVGNLDNSTFLIRNQQTLIETINELREDPFFVTLVKSYPNGDQTLNKISVVSTLTKAEWIEVNAFCTHARSGLYSAAMLLTATTPLIDENSISLKIPSDQNLQTVGEFLQNIGKSLNPLVIDAKIGGDTIVKSVENGSLWIDILLASPAAVCLVFSIVHKAMKIRQLKLSGDILKEQSRHYKLKNDHDEKAFQFFEELTKTAITKEAELIANEYYEKNGEIENRISFALKSMLAFLDSGGEVYPSIAANGKIANQCPDYSLIKTLSFDCKQIEEASGDDRACRQLAEPNPNGPNMNEGQV